MEQIKAKIRRWGNSFGIVIPKEFMFRRNLKEGVEIEVLVQEKNKTSVRDIFELSKQNKNLFRGKSTKNLMKEVDKELWNLEK